MTTKKRFAVVGSRSFCDKDTFNRVMDDIIAKERVPETIVSGGAVGADTMAYEWAQERNIQTLIFKPRYKDYPRNVRHWMPAKDRNTSIVENSDLVIAFWDMVSNGTKDTIEKSVEKCLKVYVYNLIENECHIL